LISAAVASLLLLGSSVMEGKKHDGEFHHLVPSRIEARGLNVMTGCPSEHTLRVVLETTRDYSAYFLVAIAWLLCKTAKGALPMKQ